MADHSAALDPLSLWELRGLLDSAQGALEDALDALGMDQPHEAALACCRMWANLTSLAGELDGLERAGGATTPQPADVFTRSGSRKRKAGGK